MYAMMGVFLGFGWCRHCVDRLRSGKKRASGIHARPRHYSSGYIYGVRSTEYFVACSTSFVLCVATTTATATMVTLAKTATVCTTTTVVIVPDSINTGKNSYRSCCGDAPLW